MNGAVHGWMGEHRMSLTIWLDPAEASMLRLIEGHFILNITERDEQRRPTRVQALRALPEAIGTDDVSFQDWEYAACGARIDYTGQPSITWEQPDIATAAHTWGNSSGRPRLLVRR